VDNSRALQFKNLFDPTHSPAEKLTVKQHFIALDSWRGIAALTVAFGHLKTSGFLSALPVASTSYRFVDFFFVLSGFVIAYSSGDKLIKGWEEAGRFAIKRIARLWPLHLFVLACFLLYQFALLGANVYGLLDRPAFEGEFDRRWLPVNILMVQAWETTPYATWNAPSWSISTELFAYLTFAMACVLVGRRSWVLMSVVAFFTTIAAIANPAIMTQTFSLAIVRCLAGFGIGVAIHKLWTVYKPTLIAPTALEAICAASTVLAVAILPLENGAWILPVFGMTVFIFALEQGGISAFLRKPMFVFLGARSYSIYLVHAFALVCLFSVADVLGFVGELPDGNTGIILPSIAADLLVLVFLALVVLVSHVTYRSIELPGQAMGRSLLGREGGRAPTV
jgi:peptidoglycan/LPS O-acetylase OafA/YrhL